MVPRVKAVEDLSRGILGPVFAGTGAENAPSCTQEQEQQQAAGPDITICSEPILGIEKPQ